jgi:hypothetical protein
MDMTESEGIEEVEESTDDDILLLMLSVMVASYLTSASFDCHSVFAQVST